MSKEVKAEMIDMYCVKPQWGAKNIRVVKRKILKRGKSIFVRQPKGRRWVSIELLFKTPQEALQHRLKEMKTDVKESKGYLKTSEDELKNVEKLIRETK